MQFLFRANISARGDVIYLELVSFSTKLVDLVQHSLQQRFRRGCGDARPLELSDFTALSLDLGTHPLYLATDSRDAAS
jgi:hypothetical protein